MSFEKLGLCPRIIKALDEKSYKTPSPIQTQAIPLIAKGFDIIACAQTGTGKTAAFSLPLIEKIASLNEKWRNTTVLVLSPTRELASQIVDNINDYSKYLPVRCAAIYGGVSKRKQLQSLEKGVQIVVATPGRLLDHIKQKTIDLSHVETLIFDEADRMLDMGFIKDVRKIMRHIPRGKRQTLLFSATLSKDIKDLSKEMLINPKVIQIKAENSAAEKINQVVHLVPGKLRKKLLSHLVKTDNLKQVLVFSRTRRGANKLSEDLNKFGHQSRAFHGDKTQETRKRTLDSFKNKKIDILVATDVAARGIDITDLPLVINYDLPEVPETYVHRIGRTGRAGKTGQAISFVPPEQRKLLDGIEKMLKNKIPRIEIPGYECDYIEPKVEPKIKAKAKSKKPFFKKKKTRKRF